MRLCDLTLPTPEENLACDEALLNLCEQGFEHDILRFWKPTRYFVALGYANQAAREANLEFCSRNTIPLLRRCTGGGTVLQGPGCLNYSLILRFEDVPELQGVSPTNDYVLSRNQRALAELAQAPVEKQGHTDLAIGGLKFAGNAQRRGRRSLLFHGSLLLNMDLELIGKALPMPSRQPEYRLNRSHLDFLMNLKFSELMVKSALQNAWKSDSSLENLPFDEIARLAREKYSQDSWNLKF
jgi:lipoate---protein ligase